MLYVDLAKYSEERIAVLHQRFQSWMNKAVWHRPAVIVLDNLDKVVSAEVEVSEAILETLSRR